MQAPAYQARPPQLPPGLDPVTAGRWGVWLLAKASHLRGQRRSYSATRIGGKGLTKRFLFLLLPWTVERYPGAKQALSELLGIKRTTAADYMTRPERLPRKHAETMLAVARAREAAWAGMRAELEEYINSATADRRRGG